MSLEKGSQDGMHGVVDEVSSSGEASWSPQEERKVVRKIDLILIPTLWVMSLLSWMDRANLGNANIAGLTSDLGLSSYQFSMSITVFYIGYIVSAPISNSILPRVRPSLYLSLIMCLWGIVTASMGKVNTYGQLLACRTLLGALEGGFTPGVVFVFSCWYRTEEMGKRAALFLTSGVAGGAFGGLIAGGVIDHLEAAHGIRGWRWLFIVEGATTVAASFISALILPDYPATCRKLSEEERVVAIKRLSRAGVIIHENKNPSRTNIPKSLLEALKDWRIYPFCAAGICVATTLAMAYFYPVLVKGLGYTETVKAQYMTVPIWAVALVFVACGGLGTDRAPRYRALFICACMFLVMVMSLLTVGIHDFKARYVFLAFMTGAVWGAYSQILAYTSEVYQDRQPEVRAMCIAVITTVVNTGQIYGSYIFPREQAPKYLMGFGVVAATAFVSILGYFVVWWGDRRRMKKEGTWKL